MTDDIITPEVDEPRAMITPEGRLAVATVMKRHVDEAYKDVRAEVGGDMLDEHAIHGTLKKEIRIADRKVGCVEVRHGKRMLKVVDENAALEWALENGYAKPDLEAIGHISKDVNGNVVTRSGEVVPGIEYYTGADYIQVTGCKDDDIAAALAALPGGVGADPLVLLEGGDDDDTPER